MPPPLFTTVPSLPMFVVESGGNRLISQAAKPVPLNVQSASDVIASGIESETQSRPHKKVTADVCVTGVRGFLT